MGLIYLYHMVAKCLNVRNAHCLGIPECGGINKNHKSGVNKTEHHQPKGVKLKMRECKLGRGTEAERHKTSVPCTSQNVEKFNFTRS
jgi:hypothetical protein